MSQPERQAILDTFRKLPLTVQLQVFDDLRSALMVTHSQNVNAADRILETLHTKVAGK